jgi:uncharacterized phosphosugar-binding protein
MLHEGAIASTARERESGAAAAAFARYPIRPRDVVIVISNSGVNAAPVEAARIARASGAAVIALTSRAYSEASANGPPDARGHGRHRASTTACRPATRSWRCPARRSRQVPGSTALGAALLHALFAEAAARLAADGPPPIFLSANMPGAAENNRDLVERYGPAQPASLNTNREDQTHENEP